MSFHFLNKVFYYEFYEIQQLYKEKFIHRKYFGQNNEQYNYGGLATLITLKN